MAEIPRLIADARDRASDTDKRAERVVEESGNDPAGRKLAELRLENLRTERYAALKQAEVLQAEVDAEPFFGSVRALDLELAEKQLEQLEQAFALYGEALQQAMARERRERQEELDQIGRASCRERV